MIWLAIGAALIAAVITHMAGRGLYVIAGIDKHQGGEHWQRHERIAYVVALAVPVPVAALTFWFVTAISP